jgi:hypothetical protein
MRTLDSLLASIPRLTLAELCGLIPQLAACLKACEVRLALAEGRQVPPDLDGFLNVQEAELREAMARLDTTGSVIQQVVPLRRTGGTHADAL